MQLAVHKVDTHRLLAAHHLQQFQQQTTTPRLILFLHQHQLVYPYRVLYHLGLYWIRKVLKVKYEVQNWPIRILLHWHRIRTLFIVHQLKWETFTIRIIHRVIHQLISTTIGSTRKIIFTLYYNVLNFFFSFSSMQQAYGSSSSAAAASYMNSASSFYNPTSYPYSPISCTKSINRACTSSSAYISSPYASPASPFQTSGQSSQYSPYASYSGSSASTFAQGFSAQAVDYGAYGATYSDTQASQYASSYYATQSYSPYVSSPSSSGSVGTSTYHLAATSLPGILQKFTFYL